MITLPLVTDGRSRDSADRVALRAVTGELLGEQHTAPSLLVRLAVGRMHAAASAEPVSPQLLAAATAAFATGLVTGEPAAQYLRRQALMSGLPISVARAGAQELVRFARRLPERLHADLPPTADREAVLGGRRVDCAVRWTRRSDVLAVVAASNHPAIHGSWLHALAYGYRIALRPGSRDPFTPARLAAALVEVGLSPDRVWMLAGCRETVPALVESSGLAVIYGGDDVERQFSADRRVLLRGPGRSTALVDRPLTEELLDYLAAAVSNDAGVRCTNLSTIFTTGDPRELADGLAARLARMHPLPVLDPAAVLPAVLPRTADGLAATVRRLSEWFPDHSSGRYRRGFTATMEDSSAVLRPVVLASDDSEHPFIRTELPFPFVTVAPWPDGSSVRPLRRSLVTVLLTDDDGLVGAALAEPSIRKVVLGPVLPWLGAPWQPHDGSLAHHLLQPTALLRAVP